MISKTRYLVLVIILGLSMGLVTAALAAADSMQALAVGETGSTEIEFNPPIFDDQMNTQDATEPKSVSAEAESVKIPGEIANQRGPLPEKILAYSQNPVQQSAVSAFSDHTTGPMMAANQLTELAPLAPPLPGGAEDLAICLESERVWGLVGAGETVTVTVNGTQMGAALADDVGFFWTTLYDSDGNRPGLGAGDVVAIYSNGVQQASLAIREIAGEVDVLNDTVFGAIGGTGFPLDVTVYARENEPSMTAYTQTTTTDGSGNFSTDLSGIWDFFADDWALVAYHENGVEVHQHIYAQRLVVLSYPLLNIVGWTMPGVDITATVYLADGTSIKEQMVGVSDGTTGRYEFPPSDLQVNDIVVVDIAGEIVLSRTVDTLSIQVDSVNDLVTGEADSGAIVRGIARNLTSLGSQEVQTNTMTSGGSYTLDYASLADIMPGEWSGVYIADAEGDDLVLWAPSPDVNVNQTWNEVYGRGPTDIGVDSDGLPITLTLASTDTEYYSNSDYWGWYYFSQDEHGLPDIVPGEVITVEAQGYMWQGVVEVQTMTVQADPVANQFTGEVETPPARVELSGNYYQGQLYPLGGQFETVSTASSPFMAALAGFDVNGDLSYDVLHRTAGDYAELISHQTDGVGAGIAWNGLGGVLNPPGVAYTLTIFDSSDNLKVEITGNSYEPDGNLGWINLWDYDVQIEAGDRLEAQSAAGYNHTVVIPEFWVQYNLATGAIYGQGPANELLFVNVEEGDQYQGFVPTDSSGNFVVAVDQLQQANGDGYLQWGQNIAVTYYDEVNTWLVASFDWPSIVAVYDIQDSRNQVFGSDAIPGNTINITVTDQLSQLVDSASTFTGSCDWCGTNGYVVDFPSGTIVPSNTVTVDWGDGFIDSVTVVSITGNPDVDTDIVTGTAPAGGYLSGFVEGSGGGWQDINDVEIDSSGVYTLDYGAVGWDIQYGDWFHVYYQAPRGHQVEYVFWLPAPELQIEKETTPGYAVPGGSVLYKIRYWNNGNGTAENTVIVDSLPANTTYVANSGIFPAIANSSVVTFTLGDVSPGTEGEFFISLDVDSGVSIDSELDENCVGITTSSEGDYDPGNNQTCSDRAWVTDGDHGLWIDKWPEPSDPHPGQIFQYVIDYGTDGGAANGPTWLTDTLPADTEVIGWYDEYGWSGLWTEVITTGGQFVLYAPAGIPGDMGGRIRLTLLLDGGVPLGTTLENTVVITSAGDIDPGNNTDYDDSAQAGAERYDVRLEKSISNQVPIPGQWLNYYIYYQNQGNVETHVWVTDTLPAGVEFVDAWWGGGDQPNADEPLPDPVINGNQLAWDLGMLEVAGSRWFHIQVNISDTLSVGDELTNCAAIGVNGLDDTPADNSDCVSVTLNDPGPNLRISKWYEWRDDNDRLEYTIFFENIGDQTISNVWITDTLPADTTWNGWWHMDFDWERLISESLSSDELRWQFSDLYPGDNGWIYFQADLDDPNARPAWYTNTVEIDIPPGDIDSSDNSYVTVAVLGEVERVEFWVGTENTDFWGEAQEGVAVTVTTPYTEVYAWADPGCGGCWDIGNAGPLWPGDEVVVTAGGGLLPVFINIPDPFSAEVDSTTDTVWGQLGGVVEQELQVHGDWLDGYQEVTTDASGNYNAAYVDIPRGGEGYIRYQTMVTYAEVMFHRGFKTPELILEVNYGHDWIEGRYEVGHTVWLTVTESDGITVKGRAELTSGYVPWWDGSVGFSTNWQGWLGDQPDIQAGDWVFGRVDNGETTEVQLGDISGFVDTGSDTITGAFDANWLLPDPIDVECRPWGAPEWAPNPQNKYDSILPNGTDTYTCSWDPVNEWDVEPGQNIAVYYTDPDSQNEIGNVFYEPVPYLRVEKWANGQPGEGGNITFYVQYVNQGDADAEDVVITDTMLGGMTYITDTLGLPSTGSGAPGDPLVWDVGLLPPGDWIQFEVFAQVTASPGEWITNTAEVATSNPYDEGEPWEKYAEWSGEVQSNDTHLNVGKNAWTGDPAPGNEFVWAVNVCNNGGTDSSELILTDTLPISTTLVNWWGQNPGWTEVSQDASQLVVSRPSVQGWWCGEVYLRFLLDPMVWSGMGISNTATIYASNDLETNDNSTEHWVWVNDPHTNLTVDKWWNWGQLVPGGRISYSIQASNNGNIPVDDVLLTDTLPVDTTLVGIWAYDRHWNYLAEVIPVELTSEYVVWEAGTLENGDQANYEVHIDIDNTALPGTELVNTAEISPKPSEDDYDDNIDTWVEEVNDHGPNLRIHKDGSWDDWGENTRRASYWLNVENVGDEVVMPVVITDTYESKMYLDGDIGVDFGRWWDWNDLGGSFTVTLESLEPGENVGINFSTITDTEPLPFGLIFTNTAEVNLDPADTNPADNLAEKILTTGPDLFVTKDLIAGELLPGELITFSLNFGNDNYGHEWWWNMQGDALLTDTLPPGMEYITSTLSWCGWLGQAWCDFPASVDGNELSWHMWPFGSSEMYEIRLTVLVTDTAQGGDVLTNWVEIVSSEPISDTEPYYDNNNDSYDVIVALPRFEVAKTYDTNMVAGTDVIYTLTVTNLGSEVGTNVVLSDTLPANLTYGSSDGTLVGDDVLWGFASIAPAGGTASGWFSGSLACTAGLTVDNEHYRVVSSDQGVVSEDGDPVSFTIISPTITVSFTQSTDTIYEGDQINFSATATTDGTALIYAWDFGDGSTGAGEMPSHVYTTAGVYDVSLTVTDSCGYSEMITVEDAVTVEMSDFLIYLSVIFR